MDPSVASYFVYFGRSGGATNRFLAGPEPKLTLNGLQPGETYFSYATAVTDVGVESLPSNLVIHSGPAGIPDGSQLLANAAPTIGPIEDVETTWDQAVTVSFSVADPITPSDMLSVSVGAPNTDLLNPSAALITRTDTGCALTLRPNWNAQGAVPLEVTVSNASGMSAQATFTLQVKDPDFSFDFEAPQSLVLPENSASSPQTIHLSAPPEYLEQIRLSASSLNMDQVREGSILFGGTGTSRFMIVVPNEGETGTFDVLIHANYGRLRVSHQVRVVLANAHQFETIQVGSGSMESSVFAKDGEGLVSSREAEMMVLPGTLRIQRYADQTILLWPAVRGAYLQTSDNLNSGWHPFQPSISSVDGQCRAIVNLGNAARFFRLSVGDPSSQPLSQSLDQAR